MAKLLTKLTESPTEDAHRSLAQHTPGPWSAKALGGCSTVLATVRPARADIGIPGYGYRDDAGHCIAYPFRDDAPGEVRLDFVCFSHADARLIAAAPDLLEALKIARQCIAYCRRAHKDAQTGEGFPVEVFIDAAIAKAEGR